MCKRTATCQESNSSYDDDDDMMMMMIDDDDGYPYLNNAYGCSYLNLCIYNHFMDSYNGFHILLSIIEQTYLPTVQLWISLIQLWLS